MVKIPPQRRRIAGDLQFELVEPLEAPSKTKSALSESNWTAAAWYIASHSGPLGVSLGAITRDRLEAVRESDAILREEFEKAGPDKKVHGKSRT